MANGFRNSFFQRVTKLVLISSRTRERLGVDFHGRLLVGIFADHLTNDSSYRVFSKTLLESGIVDKRRMEYIHSKKESGKWETLGNLRPPDAYLQ